MSNGASSPRIHLLGAHGQLGHALQKELMTDRLVTYDRATCDLSVPHIITRQPPFSLYPGDIVINCAAYTAVDAAETDQETAHQVNAVAPGELAAYCAARGSTLLHFSTDYVFGTTTQGDITDAIQQSPQGIPDWRPWQVQDRTCPLNVYGETKRAGEEAALAAGRTTVIRTSWLYSGPQRTLWGLANRDFVTTMLKLYRERGELTVVNDQFGCPTYTVDVARGLAEAIALLRRGETLPPIVHATNKGVASWYSFAQKIIEISGGDPTLVHPCSSSEFPTAATRPSWSVLSGHSWVEAGLTRLRPWEEALAEALHPLGGGSNSVASADQSPPPAAHLGNS